MDGRKIDRGRHGSSEEGGVAVICVGFPRIRGMEEEGTEEGGEGCNCRDAAQQGRFDELLAEESGNRWLAAAAV